MADRAGHCECCGPFTLQFADVCLNVKSIKLDTRKLVDDRRDKVDRVAQPNVFFPMKLTKFSKKSTTNLWCSHVNNMKMKIKQGGTKQAAEEGFVYNDIIT
jgi:hypothetical protein